MKFYLKALDIAAEGERYNILSNMSAAYLKLGQASSALRAANECISLSPQTPKGYLRRFRACEELEDLVSAMETLHSCLNACKNMSENERKYVERLVANLEQKLVQGPLDEQPCNSSDRNKIQNGLVFNGYPLSMQEVWPSMVRVAIEAEMNAVECVFQKRSVKVYWEKRRKEKGAPSLYVTDYEIIPDECNWTVEDGGITLDLCKANPDQRWTKPFIPFEEFKTSVESVNIR